MLAALVSWICPLSNGALPVKILIFEPVKSMLPDNVLPAPVVTSTVPLVTFSDAPVVSAIDPPSPTAF